MSEAGYSDVPRSREQRLRRMAERRGLKLTKSRLRDPQAIGYGQWTLTDAAGRALAVGDLSAIEDYLTRKGP